MSKIVFALLVFLMSANIAAATLPFQDFKNIPVLHEGRIKPMESFAVAQLRRLNGKTNLSEIEWLAESIFSPREAMDRKFILVENENLRKVLQLSEEKNNLYSFMQLTKALEEKREFINTIALKEAKSLTPIEESLFDLFVAIGEYSELLRSLTAVLPIDVELTQKNKKLFKPPVSDEVDYLLLVSIKQELLKKTQQLVKKKKSDIASYNADEQQLIQLLLILSNIEKTGEKSDLLRVLPASSDKASNWLSLWRFVAQDELTQQNLALVKLWKKASYAYQNDSLIDWSEAISGIRSEIKTHADVKFWRLGLEVFYNEFPLMFLAIAFYLSAFATSFTSKKTASVKLLFAAVFIHTTLIIIRIVVLGRPPVGNLYESILFVSLTVSAFGAFITNKSLKLDQGLIRLDVLRVVSFLSVFLFIVSEQYLPAGDSMGVLVAVLNTNFWLATHVIFITIGYGLTIVAGTLAHLYLIPLSILPAARKTAENAEKTLKSTTLLALLFTALGTLLGGIWADQSWGRFWGWDPKENGALLIVLWLVWVLHGKMTTKISTNGFAALLACANIIVALSWFGVNLLNIGLHSYGFTDSAAIGLFAFCAFELVLIFSLYLRQKRVAV